MADNIEFEKCIICGELTNVPKDLHISRREHYVEGAGQLCQKCFIKMHKDKNEEKKKNSRGV